MQAAERDYDLNRAAELKYGTLLQLQRQLKEAEQKLEERVRAAHPPTVHIWPAIPLTATTPCSAGCRPLYLDSFNEAGAGALLLRA